jgi:hypothetical protein
MAVGSFNMLGSHRVSLNVSLLVNAMKHYFTEYHTRYLAQYYLFTADEQSLRIVVATWQRWAIEELNALEKQSSTSVADKDAGT